VAYSQTGQSRRRSSFHRPNQALQGKAGLVEHYQTSIVLSFRGCDRGHRLQPQHHANRIDQRIDRSVIFFSKKYRNPQSPSFPGQPRATRSAAVAIAGAVIGTGKKIRHWGLVQQAGDSRAVCRRGVNAHGMSGGSGWSMWREKPGSTKFGWRSPMSGAGTIPARAALEMYSGLHSSSPSKPAFRQWTSASRIRLCPCRTCPSLGDNWDPSHRGCMKRMPCCTCQASAIIGIRATVDV
jgi:hypothetical protein